MLHVGVASQQCVEFPAKGLLVCKVSFLETISPKGVLAYREQKVYDVELGAV